MIWILIITMVTIGNMVNSLEPKQDDKIDEGIKKIIASYVDKIPDIEPQYVIDNGLSKVISRYFKGKISTFPLYRISLSLDRTPVKIPWTEVDPATLSTLATKLKTKSNNKNRKGERTYTYV